MDGIINKSNGGRERKKAILSFREIIVILHNQ